MKKLYIAMVWVLALFASSVNAQDLEVRVGSNATSISYSHLPFYQAGGVSFRLESGYQRWYINSTVGNQVYLTPAFHWRLTSRFSVIGGIGVSLIDRTKYRGKDISTTFQFSDHIGLTYDVGNTTVGVRYVHVSNAGIKKPNPGLDAIQLSVSFQF